MNKTLLTLVALSIVAIGYSKSFIVNNITYEVTSPNTVITTAYNTAGGTDVVIPAQVTSGPTTYDVTVIGPNSFAIKQLTSAIIPITVTEIRSGAFQNNNLTTITIPSNVTNIQSWAFLGNSITSVESKNTTPPNLALPGSNGAFDDRGDIDLIVPFGTIAAYTTDQGAKWTGFNSVTDAPDFVVDYITFEVTSHSPNTVRAKSYNTAGGTSVVIPETVTDNFITYDVTSIGPNSFFNKQLNSVTLPSSVILIRSGAFQNNNLTNITIPANVFNIQAWAFKGNPLTTVMTLGTTPSYLSAAGSNGAFDDRSVINLVVPFGTIPAYTTDQGAQWTGFNSVVDTPPFAVDNVTYQVISTSPNAVTATSYKSTGASNLMIPATVVEDGVTYSVTEISASAFNDKGLTSVTIPGSVTLIGVSAFSDNPLTSVTSESSAAPIVISGGADDSFGDRSNIDLSIPMGQSGEYAGQWTNFKSVSEVTLVGTSDFQLANEVYVFNTADVLTVNSSATARLESYTIYSISGEVKSGTESAIEIASLSKGIYILECSFNKGTFIQKFVK